MQSFEEYLKTHLVLMDGAMGTYIYQKGVFIDKCYDALNLTNPDLIRSIHEEYRNAGAKVLETNTFGANRFKLARHNLADERKPIIEAGVNLARKAAGEDCYVAGSIGPLGVEIKPFGEIALPEARDAFREQASALFEIGVDLILLETFRNVKELEHAVRAVKTVCDLPVLAHAAVLEDGKTSYGVAVEDIIRQLEALDVAAIGFNCVAGPKQMLDFLERVAGLTQTPISVMPNAGLPQYLDGRTFYMSTPEYFGVYAKRLIEAGARILGGCCGTTPEHIRKMADALAQKQSRTAQILQKVTVKEAQDIERAEPVPLAEKSRIGKKLAGREFVSMVEMVPPRGKTASKQLAGAERLKHAGVDAINIPDGPRASSRMNGLALAVLLQQRTGIETVLHYTCRDRNLLGMQSDLLGASVLGICNILAVTGDPPMMGDYPQATAVFDIDAIGLARMICNLNHGLDIGNRSIGEPTGFVIGVGVDPNSVNLTRETDRFRQKAEAGAEYAITQPVFDLSALKRFLDRVSDCPIPIIAGVWPLVSLRNAEFMKNEVPGVTVPDAVLERIARFDSKEDQLMAGIEIAQEMIREVRDINQGVQVSAPFGRYKVALEIMQDVL